MKDRLPAQTTSDYRTADGLAIRFAESGDRGEVVVLRTSAVAGEPVRFRHIWSDLAQHARLIAIDLPGFGQSERHEI
jgi:pimeloyl-ACP methyl ester carboxylesterase